ncbi:hypothetical protein V5O48_011833 [Marasmius crinis-equi]|uniref:AB hydrolase-1 domain-containing protein n=1 Tax=Marasmius crinis-equi TaxID=585013 RepID=A0ABR3F4I1_9AGAR
MNPSAISATQSEERFLTIMSKDQTEIYAEARGDASKPAVVFIHGFSMSLIVWESIFEDPKWLAQFYLVRYDIRGHGRSGKPTDEASWASERLAEDFFAVVEQFNLNKPFVVGWSLGGTYITDILSVKPASYLSGIVYINAVPAMGAVVAACGTGKYSKFTEDHEMYSFSLKLPYLYVAQVLATLPPLMQFTDVNDYQENALKFVSMIAAKMPYHLYLACLGSFIAQPRASTIAMLSRSNDITGLLKAGREENLPLLVIISEKDQAINWEGTLNAIEGWKDLKVVRYAEGDHMPWLAYPDSLRDEISGWVKDRLD